MANLIERNIDEKIVDALKARAGKHGRSAEAEHRRILEAALLSPGKKSLAEALKSCVGKACTGGQKNQLPKEGSR